MLVLQYCEAAAALGQSQLSMYLANAWCQHILESFMQERWAKRTTGHYFSHAAASFEIAWSLQQLMTSCIQDAEEIMCCMICTQHTQQGNRVSCLVGVAINCELQHVLLVGAKLRALLQATTRTRRGCSHGKLTIPTIPVYCRQRLP